MEINGVRYIPEKDHLNETKFLNEQIRKLIDERDAQYVKIHQIHDELKKIVDSI